MFLMGEHTSDQLPKITPIIVVTALSHKEEERGEDGSSLNDNLQNWL